MGSCPFCHVAFDEKGEHFCTAVRKEPARQSISQMSELERTIEVLAWAQQKGALHFKCPWFEMVFPTTPLPAENLPVSSVVTDNQQAESQLKVPFKNPLDDPDYYADAQERFFNHSAINNRR